MGQAKSKIGYYAVPKTVTPTKATIKKSLLYNSDQVNETKVKVLQTLTLGNYLGWRQEVWSCLQSLYSLSTSIKQ